MKTYYKSIITSVFAAVLGISSTAAEQTNPTPYPLPASHAISTIDVANGLIERAYESVRENSPFAQFEEEDSSDDMQLIGEMTDYAAKYLGTRYRLGASGPKAFDCSGFIGYVFKKFGFNLSRTSRAQYTQGEKVNKSDLQPGDLLFFSCRSSGRGKVGHVAMVVDVKDDGSCTFIHASTKHGVTYQKFPDNGYYSRHFIGAKRIIGSTKA